MSPRDITHKSPGCNQAFDFSALFAYDYRMNNQSPEMYDRLTLLQQYRHIAIVGISADQYRPSHFVAIYLQAEGYDIILVNPNYAGQMLLGRRVYASLTEAKEAGEQIEIVD